MIRVGIIGVTGYVGIELCRMLHQHPQVKVTQAMTHHFVGTDISVVYPHLVNHVYLKGNELNLDALIQDCDLIFIALPHGESTKLVQPLLAAGKRVIDLGADFRIKNSQDYVNWYKRDSPPVELLNEAVYGLPEISNKEAISKANLIANPGCNATAVILATYPLLVKNIIYTDDCIYDVKLSISGSGRNPERLNHFCEIADNILPYHFIREHRHTPEIEQELSNIAQKPISIHLTPHLMGLSRGILVTAYFKLKASMTAHEMHTLYQRAYENEPFIRIRRLGTYAKIKQVRGSNHCDISIHVDEQRKRLVVLSAIDNLMKGAASQAIQNMNLMYGFTQTTGIDQYVTYYP